MGSPNTKADMDGNMALLDANVAFLSDLASVADTLVGDLGLNGLVSGFQLATSNSLYPSVTNGILYANGSRYAPTDPALDAAPANATSYLFYQQENWPSSYYYRPVLAALNPGDAFIGVIVTNGTQVTNVTPSHKPLWPDPGGAHGARQFYGAASVRACSHRGARPHDQPGSHLVAIADGRGRRKPLSRCLRRWGNRKGAGMVKKAGFWNSGL